MSTLKEIKENEIYPAIYRRALNIFPEFGFKETSLGYISTTKAKITGEEGKAGAVYFYKNNPGNLIDYTRGSVSIWDYIQKRDGLSGNYDTLLHLAKLAGVVLADLTPEQAERARKETERASLWEAVNNFLLESILNSKETEAQKVRDYCKGRGYELKPGGVELGYFPSQEKLKAYLKEKKYSEEEIRSLELDKDTRIGGSHRLTITYRDEIGRVKGIAVRNIHHKEKESSPKYLYSKNLERGEILFNLRTLKGSKDLIIVEGLLDCLTAEAHGVENLVGIGGSSLTEIQTSLALQSRPEKITLCLDQDKAGAEGTRKAIEKLLSHGFTKIYIAELPGSGGKIDPDSFIRAHGVKAFKEIIEDARPYYKLLAEPLIELTQQKLTDKERADLGERITLTGSALPFYDRYEFELYLEPYLERAGIPKEIIKLKTKELAERKKEEDRIRELGKRNAEIQRALGNKDLKEAQRLLEEGVRESRVSMGRELIEPYSLNDLVAELQSTPENLRTGIRGFDKIARIPQGAITLIAGRPSHGKTTLMFNMLYQMSQLPENYGKKFYFFSYEETKKRIYTKLLNCIINQDLNFVPGLAEGYGKSKEKDLSNTELLQFIVRDFFKPGLNIPEEVRGGIVKLGALIGSSIEVIDKPLSVEELSSLVTHLHSKENIGAIFIDYMQRIRIKQKVQDKRVEVATISDYILNVIAKETGLPVILGSQISRAGKDRPSLDTLKESGNLEEDANLVVSVFNPEREKSATAENTNKRTDPIILELTTLKNRDGAVNKKKGVRFIPYSLYIDPQFIGELKDGNT